MPPKISSLINIISDKQYSDFLSMFCACHVVKHGERKEIEVDTDEAGCDTLLLCEQRHMVR